MNIFNSSLTDRALVVFKYLFLIGGIVMSSNQPVSADGYNWFLPPLILVEQGDHQQGTPGAFEPLPIVLKVIDSGGNPITQAPVTLTTDWSQGQLSETNTDGYFLTSNLNLQTDSNGQITFYYYLSPNAVSPGLITVTAGTAVITLNRPLSALQNLTASPTPQGTLLLQWTNSIGDPSNSILIQQQNSDGTFSTLSTLSNSATSYEVAGTQLTQNYTFQIIATDEVGRTPTSVTYTSPIPQNGLSLWMRADVDVSTDSNGYLNQWSDLSLNNYVAQTSTGQQPQISQNTYNGKPAISFDGASQYLQIPTLNPDFIQQVSVFAVFNPTASGSWSRIFDFGNGAASSNILLAREGTSANMAYNAYQGSNVVNQIYSYNDIQNNQLQEYTVVDDTQTQANMFRNGILAGTAPANLVDQVARTSNFIGMSNWPDALFQGDICELVIYNRAVSTGEQQQIEGYLADKYGIYNPHSTWPNAYSADVQTRITAFKWNKAQADTYVAQVALNGVQPPANIALWLKADTGVTADSDGNVSQWQDQSTNQYITTQSNGDAQPLLQNDTVTGLPTLHFDGGQFLSGLDQLPLNQDVTILVASSCDDTQPFSFQFTAGTNPSPGNTRALAYRAGQPVLDVYYGSAQAGLASPSRQLNITGVVFNKSSNTATFYGAGQFLGSTSTGFSNDITSGYTIGASGTFDTFWNGNISEVLVYNRALSDSERSQAELYLANKYGLFHPSAAWIKNFDSNVQAEILRNQWNKNQANDYVTLLANHPPIPPSGLALWLKGDAGVTTDGAGNITRWQDQSATHNDGSQINAGTQPQLIDPVSGIAVNPGTVAEPVVHFSGNQYLSIFDHPSLRPDNITVFAVAKEDTTNPYQTLLSRGFYPGSDWNYPYVSYDFDLFGVNLGNGLRSAVTSLGTLTEADGANTYPTGKPQVFDWSYDGTNQLSYVSGQVTNSQSTVGPISYFPQSSNLALGSRSPDSPGEFLNGDVSEVVVYNRVLSDDERNQVEIYLANKYGLYHPNATWTLAYSQDIQNLISSNHWNKNQADAEVALQQANPTLPLGGLVACYKADTGIVQNAGLVSSWNDLSPNGYNLSQSNPGAQPSLITDTRSSRPTVQFNGSQVLSNPNLISMANNDVTIVTVAQGSGVSVNLGASYGVSGTRGVGVLDGEMIFTNGFPNGSFSYFSGESLVANVQLQNMTTTFSREGDAINFYLDGMVNKFINNVFIDASDLTSGLIVGGASTTDNSKSWNGNISEVLIYDHVLSSTERKQVEVYLAQKYNLNYDSYYPNAQWISQFSPDVQNEINVNQWNKSQATAYAAFLAIPQPLPQVGMLAWLKADNVVQGNYDSGPFQHGFSQYDNQISDFGGVTIATDGYTHKPAFSLSGALTSNDNVITSPSFTVITLANATSDDNFALSRNLWSGGGGSYGLTTPTAPEGGGQVLPVTGTPTSNLGPQLDGGPLIHGEFLRFGYQHNPGYSDSLAPLYTGMLPSQVPMIHTVVYDSSAKNTSLYLNGVLEGTETNSSPGNASPIFTLGSAFANNPWSGNVSEVIVYDHALTDDERTIAENYLIEKYNLISPAPTITPFGGIYQSNSQLPSQATISSTYPGAIIYYTTDGSEPDTTSNVYSQPIPVSPGLKITAKAVVPNRQLSADATAQFVIDPSTQFNRNNILCWFRADYGTTLNQPVAMLPDASGGTYQAIQNDSGLQPVATIPAGGGPTYLQFGSDKPTLGLTQPLPDLTNATVIAVAKDNSGSNFLSDTGDFQFRSEYPPAVHIVGTKNGGQINSLAYLGVPFDRQRILSWVLTPNLSSVYRENVLLNAFTGLATDVGRHLNSPLIGDTRVQLSELLIFKSALSDGDRSNVVQYLQNRYGLNTGTATPFITPTPSYYVANATVSISCATPGATIYYRAYDVGQPPGNYSAYTGPFTISQHGIANRTVQIDAQAKVSGLTDSGIATSTYTLTPDPNAPPYLSQISFNDSTLPDSGTISSPGNLSVNAVSVNGIGQVQFYLDGNLYATSSVGANDGTYKAFIDTASLSDGAHSLKIVGYDSKNVASTVNQSLYVELAVPSSPKITNAPANGGTPVTPLLLLGNADPGTTLTFYDNTVPVSTATVDLTGNFIKNLSLNLGVNSIAVTAKNRAGESAPSPAINIVFDNTLPQATTQLTVTPQANGQVKLSWNRSNTLNAAGYQIYRSNQPFTDISQATLVATVNGLNYTDSPATDGTYYYVVVTVGGGGITSVPSSAGSGLSDRVPPTASIQYTAKGPFDPATQTYGVGSILVDVTVSKPLSATPFLTLLPSNGLALPIVLTPGVDNLHYTGTLMITSSTASGLAQLSFNGTDQVGNKGTILTSGQTLQINTSGPSVTQLVSALADPVQNSGSTPTVMNFVATLSEAIPLGTTPQFSYTLSTSQKTPVAVSSVTAGTSRNLWNVALSLPANAGLTPETLTLFFQAKDSFGNPGNTIVPSHQYQIYQGSLPGLNPPGTVMVKSLPAGAVEIDWTQVSQASGYAIYRGTDPARLSIISQLSSALTYTDLPQNDGTYYYAVATVRQANGVSSIGALSDPVQSGISLRTLPNPPSELAAQLVSIGVKLSWIDPVNSNQSQTLSLYRSGSPITVVAGLKPLAANIMIGQLSVVDPSPSLNQPYYAIATVDAAGNISSLSSTYFNSSLLPVSTLSITQTGNTSPVISWTDSTPNLSGYNIAYVSGAASQVLNNTGPLTSTTYTDSSYLSGGVRTYSLTALDTHGAASLPRTLSLIPLSVTLDSTTTIKRGLFNIFNYTVVNATNQDVPLAQIQTNLVGKNQLSAIFSVPAGNSVTVPVVVGGYASLLGSSAQVTTTINELPHAGETVSLVQTQNVPISQGTLPLSVNTSSFILGGNGQAQFSLTNTSSEPIQIVCAENQGAQPSPEVRFTLMTPDGTTFSVQPIQFSTGNNVILLPSKESVIQIDPGMTYTSPLVNIPLPANAGASVTVQANLDSLYYHRGQSDEIALEGISAQHTTNTSSVSYTGSITSVAPMISNGTQPIVITGSAITANSDPNHPTLVPNSSLTLGIGTQGFERTFSVTTDNVGNFTYTFTPDAGEPGGSYTVWAVNPALSDNAGQQTFTIQKLVISPTQLTAQLPTNYTQNLSFSVKNSPGGALSNLHFEYNPADQPGGSLTPGITISGSSIGLGPNQQGTLKGTLLADNTAPSNGTLYLRVASTENSLWSLIEVDYQFGSALPALQATPSPLELGTSPGQSISQSVSLQNVGLAPLEAATVQVLTNQNSLPPGWVSLNSATTIPTLAVNAATPLDVTFSPDSSVPTGDYYFKIGVTAQNHEPFYVPIHVVVSSASNSSAEIQVVDAFSPGNMATGFTGGLAGATVTLQNQSVYSQIFSQQTGSDGIATFANVPVGTYTCQITSQNHQTYSGTALIQPGITYTQQTVLQYNPVTITWSVVQTSIQDVYNIVLNYTFETNVPVPVLTFDPPGVSFPNSIQAGDVVNIQTTVANKGAIRADTLQFGLPKDDDQFHFDLISSIPDHLEAGQSFTILYKMTSLRALNTTASLTSSKHSQFASTHAQSLKSMLYSTLFGQTTGATDNSYGSQACLNYSCTCDNGTPFNSTICQPITSQQNKPKFINTGGEIQFPMGTGLGASHGVPVENIRLPDPSPSMNCQGGVQIAVDANRDGDITFHSDGSSDDTSETSPYRFWLNDDEDVQGPKDPVFQDNPPEIVPPVVPDSSNSNNLTTSRDLEDWTRLWIQTKGLSDQLQSGQVFIGFKWKTVDSGNPGIRLLTASDPQGGLGYINTIQGGKDQSALDPNDPATIALRNYIKLRLLLVDQQITSTSDDTLVSPRPVANPATNPDPTEKNYDFIIPSWVWKNSATNNDKTCFLFEGCTEGMGELKVVLLDSSGNDLGDTKASVWLDLKQIKKMYDRGHSVPDTDHDHYDFPYNNPQVNSIMPSYVPGDTGENQNPVEPFTQSKLVSSNETNQLIVFVHGITVTLQPYTNFSQTMFKRLWWAGYKGRFAAFQWSTPGFPSKDTIIPPGTGANTDAITDNIVNTTVLFNNGEYHAWNCGKALADFVQAERTNKGNPTVGVVAHSLGNVTAASAYNSGLKTDYYVAMNAAISLSCFIPSENKTKDPTKIIDNDSLAPDFDKDLIYAETPHNTLNLLGGLTSFVGSSTPDYYRGFCHSTLDNAKHVAVYYSHNDYWLQSGFIYGQIPVNWQQDQYFSKPTVFYYGTNTAGTLELSTSNITSKFYGWNIPNQDSGPGYKDDVYTPTQDSITNQILTPTRISSIHRDVTNPFEQLAYISRSRTLALGAQIDPQWASMNNNARIVDLISLYGFSKAQSDHSGAFNRSIQDLSDPSNPAGPFYSRLILDLTGKLP